MNSNSIKQGKTIDADIFISYSSKDRSKVLSIVEQISSLGPTIWMDLDKIEGGQIYGPEIVRAIKGCKVFILMSSKNSFQSRNVHKEIMLAWRFQRPYLPLLIELLQPDDYTDEILFWLEGHQWIEVAGISPDAWLPRVTRALFRLGIPLAVQPQQNALQDSLIEQRKFLRTIQFATGINGLYDLARLSTNELRILPVDSPNYGDIEIDRRIYSGSDRFKIEIKIKTYGHLLLLNISPRNRVHCLVPSLFAPRTEYKPGTIAIPSPETNFPPLQVSGMTGRERLLAIFTKDPLHLNFMPGESDKITRLLTPVDVEDLIRRLSAIEPDRWDLVAGHFDVVKRS